MRNSLILLLVLSTLAVAQTPKRYLKQFTRPANITTYAAGDVVSDSSGLPFKLVPAGEFNNGTIIGIKLSLDTPNVAYANFRLFMFSDSINLGMVHDNTAFIDSSKTDSLMIGWADFTLSKTGTGSGSTMAFDGYLVSQSGFGMEGNFRARAVQPIWGILTATAAYVPKFMGIVRIVTIMEVE